VLALKNCFGLLKPLSTEKKGSLVIVGQREHREAELKAAQGAVAVLKDAHGLVPLKPGGEIILVNATSRDSYRALEGTRGIGPNQVKPAFDFFAEAVKRRRPGTISLGAEEILKGEWPMGLNGDALVVAVTENYPLPGMDFDQASQPKVIKRLMEKAGKRLIVVGLRDPYELRHFPDVPTYVCAFSFRPCAAEAAAKVLFGEEPARGKSPVSVPGTGVKA
jgi:beta-N-acetylhexosaminidase